MAYTVLRLAKLAGVSVRTLHFYDEIGLLKPAYTGENGYGFYAEKEVERLQQILFFRELEFPLEKIRNVMQPPDYSSLTALIDQEKLLELKKERIQKLLQTIKTTIQSVKGGATMTQDDTFSAFNDPKYQKHKDEVERRWGNTEAYKQSEERVGKMSKADLEKVKQEAEDIAQTTAELMLKGFVADSPEVQKQIKIFYQYLHHFYDPSYEMFKGLGQMYVDDPRFTDVYEKRAKGFALFMRDAMGYYAEIHLKQ